MITIVIKVTKHERLRVISKNLHFSMLFLFSLCTLLYNTMYVMSGGFILERFFFQEKFIKSVLDKKKRKQKGKFPFWVKREHNGAIYSRMLGIRGLSVPRQKRKKKNAVTPPLFLSYPNHPKFIQLSCSLNTLPFAAPSQLTLICLLLCIFFWSPQKQHFFNFLSAQISRISPPPYPPTPPRNATPKHAPPQEDP